MPIDFTLKSQPRQQTTNMEDEMDQPLKLGILLWSQATDWPSMRDAGRRIDSLGYDYLWTWARR
jgi:hypothetical protein